MRTNGAISNILTGWNYISKTCSCQGKSQHEIYRKENNTIKYYFKTNEFKFNNEDKKSLTEIEAYI
jgi:hypothetical protein